MKMYSDLIYKKHFDVIFISILNDVNLGIYERKNTGELVAFTEAYYPLTDEKIGMGILMVICGLRDVILQKRF